ncbi:hypothetical protein D3C85_976190 [compost metagenome]
MPNAAIFRDRLGQQRHAHARRDARQNAIQRAQLHDLVRHKPHLIEPVFQCRAIEAAGAKHQHGLLGHFFDQRGQCFELVAADQHQFFVEHFLLGQRRILVKTSDKRAVESMGLNRLDQLHRGAGQQRQLHLGKLLAVLGQHLRQTNSGGGFH